MKYCLVITLMCLLASSVSSAYVTTITGAPSTEPGYTTYTFAITPTGTITSAESDFSASAMRQLNPSSLPTIFEDANADIISDGGAVDSDSQFEFHIANDNLLVVSSGESATDLNAGFTGFAPLDSPFNLAHVVLPNGVTGTYSITMIEDSAEITQTGVISPGDVDGNGYVSASDLTIVIDNWGRDELGWAGGDLNGDGTTDGFDYNKVVSYWTGVPTEPSGQAIPEPATVLVLLGGAMLSLIHRR